METETEAETEAEAINQSTYTGRALHWKRGAVGCQSSPRAERSPTRKEISGGSSADTKRR